MNYTENLLLKNIIKSNSILDGHFYYTSNIHTRYYIDTSLLFQNPMIVSEIAEKMARELEDLEDIDYIITPNYKGGFLLAHNVADLLNAKVLVLRRVQGQIFPIMDLNINRNTIVIDDGLNSGTSLNQILSVLGTNLITPKGICIFLNRYNGDLNADFGYDIKTIINLPKSFRLINTEEEPCELCSEWRYLTEMQKEISDGDQKRKIYNKMSLLQLKCVYNGLE